MQEIIAKTNAYLKKHPDISQQKLAKMANISGGSLSQFLSGTYKGKNETLAKKLLSTIEAEDSREKSIVTIKEPEYVETQIMQQMCFGLNYARDRNDIIIIYGAPGIGKTVTLKRWLEENPTSIYFTASPNVCTKRSIMDEMLEALCKKPEGRCDRLQKTIITALKNTNRAIVIDEAHFLRLEALETLRSIYDETKCPIILVGNTLIMEKITERNKNITGQFFSRAVRIELDKEISIEDVKKIILQNGVELDEDCIAELHKVANGVGAFRVMTKMFLFAWTIANGTRQKISFSHILSAKKVIVSV